MLAVVQALVPVILAILAGYGFRHYGRIADETWKQFGFLTYYLFMPALEIKVLANRTFEQLPWAGVLGAIFSLLGLLTLVLLAWQRWGRPQPAATFTSLYQGGIRFNTFIALVLGAQLYGDAGVAAVAVIAAVMILLINLLCLGVFSLYVGGWEGSVKLARELALNPLILGCLIGFALNLSGVGLPGPSEAFVGLMAEAALPVGLMAVGAGLRIAALRGSWEVIGTASLIQLVAKPLLASLAAGLWGLEGLLAAALILCFVVPTAPSAYVLALQKGGDSQTMASIITLQTLVSAITIPLFVGGL